MAFFKCKMCGGSLDVPAGSSVIECEYCGTQQTLPKLDDDKRANLYDRANHFRRNNEFDKAMGIYEQILNEDKADAEAYWSIVLCRYGIEYVEDPSSHRRIPTVNRAQFTSILADEDYKAALANADMHQRSLYESEARAIDEIQKGILAISSKEEPFDVFICYKETDNNGRRTPDSVLAQDLYYGLKNEGFKVFFARITLEDKLGSAYEPYIFAALNSAKVMVVLGTKPAFFNAVWVKNEWNRYLALIKQGQKKMLIPAYKDMDPYDLPEEFSHLQAQDMSKLGFMQDLIRGIKKIAGEEKKEPVKETVIVNQINQDHDIAPLLKRAFLFLEDGDFDSADEYAEKILDIDPECSDAYIVKLLIDLKMRSASQISSHAAPIDRNPNYVKALRFAKGDARAKIENYNRAIVDRIELDNKKQQYANACALMNARRYDEAIATFSKISTFKDSADKIEACRLNKENDRKEGIYAAALRDVASSSADDKAIKKSISALESIKGYKDADAWIEKLQARLEKWYEDKRAADEMARIKAEQDRLKAEQNKKKAIKAAKIGIPSLVALVLVVILTVTLFIPMIRFNKADKLFVEGKYDEANRIYGELDGFGDSEKRVSTIKAIDQIEAKKIEDGIKTLLAAGVPVEITYQTEGGSLTETQPLSTGYTLPLDASTAPLAAEESTFSEQTVFTFDESADFTGLKTPGRNGYRFVAWVLDGYAYDVDAKDAKFCLTLKATWSTKDYVVEYALAGGSLSKSNIAEYDFEDEAFSLINPTRKGYTFAGWIGTDLAEPTMTVTVPTGSYGDRTYTATWTANEYTVTYDAAGGTISADSQKVFYDSNVEHLVPARTGYIFLGWYCDGKLHENGIWSIDSNIRLTAKWATRTDIPYVVNHYQQNANDSGYTLESTQNFQGTADAAVTPAVKSYDHFIAPSTKTVTIAPDGTLVVDYYYDRVLYTLTYVTNGGNTIAEQSYKYGQTLDLAAPTRAGYTFGGWFTNVGLTSACSATTTLSANTTVYAYWTEENKAADFTYSGTSEITITKYIGSSTIVNIPKYIDGVLVTTIASEAFQNKTKLTTVVIPDSVTSIRSSAFYNCSSLMSVTIPNSVTAIHSSAFYNCSSLTSVTIPNSVTSIGTGAFKDCSSLTSVTIGNAVTSIGSYAFEDCNSLTSITIPNSVTIIDYGAFKGCSSLTSITLPFIGATPDISSTLYLGYIFGASSYSYNSTYVPASLREVVITGGTSIDSCAFYKCSSLTSITIPNSVTKIRESAFEGCSGLTSIVIPDSVTSIGESAFYGCSSLTSITIPNGVTIIDSDTFGNCSSLTSIAIPNSVMNIYSSAFEGCSGLTSVTIPNSVTSISSYAFAYCSSLTSVTIPNSVTSIGPSAFSGCSSLTSIVIPDSVTSIGSSAFSGCSSLTSITLPFVGASKDGTTNTHFGYIFGASSYSSNSNYVPASLKTVVITGGTSIGGSAFYKCSSLTSIAIPNSVTSISSDAFYGCSGLTSITLPFVGASKAGTTNTHFGYVFGAPSYSSNSSYVPTSLREVVITGGTSIGFDAFYNCSSLTSIVIPDSVTSIGEWAFEGCSSLTSITIPNSVTSIGSRAFYNCSNLTSVHITDLSAWCQISFDGYDSTPLYYVADLYLNGELVTDLVIPDSVTSIGNYAFSGCSSLTSIVIPDSVTSIGEKAFYNCSGVTSITLPFVGKQLNGTSYTHFGYIFGASEYFENNNYVPTLLRTVVITGETSIGGRAFDSCHNLTNIVISGSVTSIGAYAFYGCSGLTSVTIPNSVTSIGSDAFYNCSSLTSITIPNSVTSIGSRAFSGCSNLTSVHITDLSAWCQISFDGYDSTPLYYAEDLYLNGELVTDLVIPDSVTSIGNYAFYNCSNLTSITIPDSVTSIGEWAFYNCSSLTSITLPFVGASKDGTTNTHFGYVFGTSSYYSNDRYVPTSLREVVITGGTSIGEWAFYNCSGLTSITIPDSVTSLGEYAFYGCSNLTSVTIGSGVTSIGYNAFLSCNSLTTVYYNGTAADWAKTGISDYNICLTAATTRYYYSETQPTTTGNYWHYVDGVPTKWD